MLDAIIKKIWSAIYKTTLSSNNCNIKVNNYNITATQNQYPKINTALLPIRMI